MDLEAKRLELHEILVDALGSRNVYFQPPASIVMQYSGIEYHRERANVTFADNSIYLFKQRYMVTLMTVDPDSPVFFKLISLPLASHERSYAVDDLNHDVFNLYF